MNDKQPPEENKPRPLTAKETYNLVTDTATGVNIRWRDNLCQGLAILICAALGAGIGYWIMKYSIEGLVLGGFIGLLAGLFGSGNFLMIFRAIRHSKGRHD